MSDELDEIRDIFRVEADERLSRMSDILAAARSGTGTEDIVDDLFREAHTLKGSARLMGFDAAGDLAHAAEDLLGRARGERGEMSPELIESLLDAVAAIRRAVDEAPADTHADADPPRSASPPPVVETTPKAPVQRPPAATPSRAVRVSAERLDYLIDLAGEAVLEGRRSHAAVARSGVDDATLDRLDAGRALIEDLQATALDMRLVAFEDMARGLPATFREMGRAEGREAELVVTGGEVMVDRAVLETVLDALTHVLRNAIAHGVETPEERLLAGKSGRSIVRLGVSSRGETIDVTVSDDGRGVSEEVMARVTDGRRLIDILAEPGYSTAGAVTDLAGRGVGLDAVRATVEGIGGDIDIESTAGAGTTVTIMVPVTVSLVEVLVIERHGRPYALPVTAVHAVVGALTDDGHIPMHAEVDGGDTGAVPVRDLADVLGQRAPALPRRARGVAVGALGRQVVVLCNSVAGIEEVQVRHLGPVASRLPALSGGAFLANGCIALVLDPRVLVDHESRGAREPDVADRSTAAAPGDAGGGHTVLVVEDSATLRSLVVRMLRRGGFSTVEAQDGREGLVALRARPEIDAVITDIEMPEMNGLELIRAIRTETALADVPIVVLTTLAGDEDRARAMDAGCDSYLVKRDLRQGLLVDALDSLLTRTQIEPTRKASR